MQLTSGYTKMKMEVSDFTTTDIYTTLTQTKNTILNIGDVPFTKKPTSNNAKEEPF